MFSAWVMGSHGHARTALMARASGRIDQNSALTFDCNQVVYIVKEHVGTEGALQRTKDVIELDAALLIYSCHPRQRPRPKFAGSQVKQHVAASPRSAREGADDKVS